MLFFDDLGVGYRSRVGDYLLEQKEVVEFAEQWDPQPFHIDEAAARESIFGGLTASSLHLFAICTRLFFDHADQIQIMAMVGKDVIRIPAPARVGDRLTYWTECVEHTPSKSKDDRGVIVLQDSLVNEAGTEVLTQNVTLIVRRQIET